MYLNDLLWVVRGKYARFSLKETHGPGGAALELALLDEQAVRPAGGDARDRGGCGGQGRHGAGAVGGGAVAELAGGVVAPGERRPAGGDRQAVVGAGGDGPQRGGRRQRGGGRQEGGVGAAAELAVVVEAPGEAGAVGAANGEAVGAAAGDGPDGDAPERRGRHEAVGGVAGTELAVVVEAPRQSCAVGADGEAVVPARRDGRHAGAAEGHRHGGRAAGVGAGTGAGAGGAELAVAVVAPGVDGAGGGEGQVGGPAGCDPDEGAGAPPP